MQWLPHIFQFLILRVCTGRVHFILTRWKTNAMSRIRTWTLFSHIMCMCSIQGFIWVGRQVTLNNCLWISFICHLLTHLLILMCSLQYEWTATEPQDGQETISSMSVSIDQHPGNPYFLFCCHLIFKTPHPILCFSFPPSVDVDAA